MDISTSYAPDDAFPLPFLSSPPFLLYGFFIQPLCSLLHGTRHHQRLCLSDCFASSLECICHSWQYISLVDLSSIGLVSKRDPSFHCKSWRTLEMGH